MYLLFKSSVRVWKSSTLLCLVLSLSLYFFTSSWAANRWKQLTRWCLSSQRKHFRNQQRDWLLLKSEKCLQQWLILRLFCSRSVRSRLFFRLTYSAVFIVFNCTFFSCSFWSSLSTSDLFCTSMMFWMIMYSSDNDWSKTWKRRSDLNKSLMSFCVATIFQVSLTRCIHVFSIKIFINIL